MEEPGGASGVFRLPLAAAAGGPVAGAITPAIIRAVVDDFYAACRRHPQLGPIFKARIEDWESHLARIRAFWEAAILRTGGYAGRPLEAHLAIPSLDRRHFSAWLRLWGETVSRHCRPEDAAVLMAMAGRMAGRIMGSAGLARQDTGGV